MGALGAVGSEGAEEGVAWEHGDLSDKKETDEGACMLDLGEKSWARLG